MIDGEEKICRHKLDGASLFTTNMWITTVSEGVRRIVCYTNELIDPHLVVL